MLRAVFKMYSDLGRSIAVGFRSPQFLVLLSVSAMIATSGAAIMMRLEGWYFIDALYFCVVSMATVGYGDFTPVTVLGKIFTMAYLVVGIGVFVLTVSSLAEAIFTDFRKRLGDD